MKIPHHQRLDCLGSENMSAVVSIPANSSRMLSKKGQYQKRKQSDANFVFTSFNKPIKAYILYFLVGGQGNGLYGGYPSIYT